MKAAVYHGRHDIRIQSVPEPDDPCPGEVVLEVLRARDLWDGLVRMVARSNARAPAGDARPRVRRARRRGRRRCRRSFARGQGRLGRGGLLRSLRVVPRRSDQPLLDVLTLGLQLNGGLAQLVETPAAVCRRVPDDVLGRCGGDGPAACRCPPCAAANQRSARSGMRRDRSGRHRLVHPRSRPPRRASRR